MNFANEPDLFGGKVLMIGATALGRHTSFMEAPKINITDEPDLFGSELDG